MQYLHWESSFIRDTVFGILKNFSRELRDRKLLHPQMGLCYLIVWLLPMDVVTTMFLIRYFLNVFRTRRHLCHLLSHFFNSTILSVWHFLFSVMFCWAMAYYTLVGVSERSWGRALYPPSGLHWDGGESMLDLL